MIHLLPKKSLINKINFSWRCIIIIIVCIPNSIIFHHSHHITCAKIKAVAKVILENLHMGTSGELQILVKLLYKLYLVLVTSYCEEHFILSCKAICRLYVWKYNNCDCCTYHSAINLRRLCICIYLHKYICPMQLFGLHSHMDLVAKLVARFYCASTAVHHALLPGVTSNLVCYLGSKWQCIISVLRIKSFVIRTTML